MISKSVQKHASHVPSISSRPLGPGSRYGPLVHEVPPRLLEDLAIDLKIDARISSSPHGLVRLLPSRRRQSSVASSMGKPLGSRLVGMLVLAWCCIVSLVYAPTGPLNHSRATASRKAQLMSPQRRPRDIQGLLMSHVAGTLPRSGQLSTRHISSFVHGYNGCSGVGQECYISVLHWSRSTR